MAFARENLILMLSGLIAWGFALLVDLRLALSISESWPWHILGYYLGSLVFLVLVLKDTIREEVRPPVTYINISIGILFTFITIAQPYTVVSAIVLIVWNSLVPYVFYGSHMWRVYFGVNGVFIVITFIYKNSPEMIMTNLSFVAFGLFAMSSSLLRIKNEIQAKALEKSNLELLAAQNLLGVQSAEQERIKIARDLHDGIGQKLTGLSLKLEVARHKPPQDLVDFLDNTKALVGETLTDLRHIVTEMRHHESLEVDRVIAELVHQLPDVEFECRGFIPIRDAQLSQELVYCLQEGVSNGIRHGRATGFTLEANELPQHIQVSLSDNGTFTGQTQSRSSIGGNGLIGMQERLSPFNGCYTLEQNDQGGATLSLIFPKHYASEGL